MSNGVANHFTLNRWPQLSPEEKRSPTGMALSCLFDLCLLMREELVRTRERAKIRSENDKYTFSIPDDETIFRSLTS